MQPTAQAVGKHNGKRNKPHRGERKGTTPEAPHRLKLADIPSTAAQGRLSIAVAVCAQRANITSLDDNIWVAPTLH